MKCRACKEIMKTTPQSFDPFSFMNPITPMYCNNTKCVHFGFMTVAGIPEEETSTEA